MGVTEAQTERGEVLPICLAEIENCRPYFIGLVGERYGFVPESIHPELVETQPWLAEHRERSLTELEILHGVLNAPEMAPRAAIYFREPGHLDMVPTDRAADYVSEGPEARVKLQILKNRIRQSGLHLREEYGKPETLGDRVLDEEPLSGARCTGGRMDDVESIRICLEGGEGTRRFQGAVQGAAAGARGLQKSENPRGYCRWGLSRLAVPTGFEPVSPT